MSKTTKTIIWLVIIIVVIAGIWWGVSRKLAQSPTVEKKVIKIGAILPLTGDAADIGQGQKNAIELAVASLEDLYPNIDIQVIFEDDRLRMNDAVTAVHKLISVDKVDAIIGPSWSGATLAVAPIAESSKVVLISPSASSPSITTSGDYIFRVFPADDELVKIVANFTLNDLKLTKAAILFDSTNDAFVQERNYIKSEFEKLGGEIVAEEAFKTKDKDFKTQLLKIKSSKAEVLFFSAYPTETGIFLKQAKEMGLKIPRISLDTIVENPEVIDTAGEAAEGVIYLIPAKPDNKEYFNYITVYKEKYGKEPPALSAEAYDALILAVNAILKSDGTKEDIKNQLYKIGQNYMGASGEITFDENGDVHKQYTFKTIKNGKFVPYKD